MSAENEEKSWSWLGLNFCWVCGSLIVKDKCPECNIQTTPPYAGDSISWESLNTWWKRQFNLVLITLRRFAVLQAKHPEVVEALTIQQLKTEKMVKTLEDMYATTFCMVCGEKLDRRNVRTVKRALCDLHYLEARRQRNKEAAKKNYDKRHSGVLLGKRPATPKKKQPKLSESDIQMLKVLPPVVATWYVRQSQTKKSAFWAYLIKTPKFQKYLGK